MDLNKADGALMAASSVLVTGCLTFVFALKQSVAVPFFVLGHAAAMVSAAGIKLGCIMRLAAQARQKK